MILSFLLSIDSINNSSIDLFNKFENILRLIDIEEEESIIVGYLNCDLLNKTQEDYITKELNFIKLCRRSEVSKMHLKSNFLSLCKPLRNESSIIVFLT